MLKADTGRTIPLKVRPISSRSARSSMAVATRWWTRIWPRLGLAAQARGQVGDGADGPVVPAALEADGADGGVALGDADAEAELVDRASASRRPGRWHALAHRQRHPHGALGRIGHRHRVVEEDHHAVAGEALERALVGEDQAAHLGVVLAEHAHDLLRLGGLREGGEAAQVEEDDGHLAPMGLERILGAAGHDQLGELGREEALEPPEPLELADLLRRRAARASGSTRRARPPAPAPCRGAP